MQGPVRRHRASTNPAMTTPANEVVAKQLHDLLESLDSEYPVQGQVTDPAASRERCDTLRQIRQLLIDSPKIDRVQDSFRHSQGFEALLNTLRSLSGCYDASAIGQDAKEAFFELVKCVLDVLSEALAEHKGNRRYFSKRVEGAGWRALEEALASTGIGGDESGGPEVDHTGQSRLYGTLFAFALGEESVLGLFSKVTNASDIRISDVDGAVDSRNGDDADAQARPHTGMTAAKQEVRKLFTGNEVLVNPEIIATIVNFALAALRRSEELQLHRNADPVVSVIIALDVLADFSEYNKVAIHGTQILSNIVSLILKDDSLGPLATAARSLASNLCSLGLNDLNDVYELYRQACISDRTAEFLLDSILKSRGPPFIQFDFSLYGYSSVELTTLNRHFPPAGSGGGYSFTAWIRVDKFDTNDHTTIFGAFDNSQTCFVLMYIEKGTRHFILQTSVTSARPSVRFKSVTFTEGIWYHVALVHRRQKIGTSKAALYINGEFAEQVRCHYPANPPASTGSSEPSASASSVGARAAGHVQVFLGTPQDLSNRLGRNVNTSKWSLASAHLFQEALSDEVIAVYQKLGPRYHGNFQDCLGSFQTYRASAELNLHNELLHPGKEEKSEIVSAIRYKASTVLPEHHVLLSISPTAALDDNDTNNIDESQLIRSLSKKAAKNLHQYTKIGGNSIIINAAVPSINDALTQPHGVAILTGSPVVVVPHALDDASWRVGGCAAIGLKLVELAQSKEAVIRAVTILFELVQENWRNSEAMEKDNGFAALGVLLKDKLNPPTRPVLSGTSTPTSLMSPDDRETLSLELLQLILRFVGYDAKQPQESLIINPLAYRTLLVDPEMWRKCSLDTQKLYYEQFTVFVSGSKHHHFNSKRLVRMRIVKRFTDALKGESFTAEVFPYFIRCFKILVQRHVSSEVLRSLSLLVTYGLQDGRVFTARPVRAKSSAMQLRPRMPVSPGGPSIQRPGTPNSVHFARELTKAEIGFDILEMYTDLLCDDASGIDVRRFAKTVSNKWLLYLLAEPDVRVVVLAAKILARLLVVHGPVYVTKFAEKSGGFVVLKTRLRQWWNVPQIWTICFAILFGRDVASLDFERDFDLFNLLDTFNPAQKLVVKYPEVLIVLAAMLEAGLKSIVKDQDISEKQSARNPPGTPTRPSHGRKRSMSVNTELQSNTPSPQAQQRVADNGVVLQTVVQFLSDLQSKSESFRDFTVAQDYIQELLFVLYPVVVSSDIVSAETELHSRGSSLNFNGQDVVIRPHSRSSMNHPAPIVRTTVVEPPPSPATQRAAPLRRGSSFILLTAHQPEHVPSPARLNPIMSPRKSAQAVHIQVSNRIVEGLLEVVVSVFLDQVFNRQNFPGFGIYLKVPPGFQEHQAYFETYVLLHTMTELSNSIQLRQALLLEPRVLTNLSKYCLHMSEAVFEGWFMNGAEQLLDFTGNLLDHLQRPDIAQTKSVRLCATAVVTIRQVFMRVCLLRLSELDEQEEETETIAFLNKLMYWQTILLSPDNIEVYFLRLLCYLLYIKLISVKPRIRSAAVGLWRMLLVQKPRETAGMFNQALSPDQQHLSKGFKGLASMDDDVFLNWIDDHREEMDSFLFGNMSKVWEAFVTQENRATEESARNRIAKRKDRLKQWINDETKNEDITHRHEVTTNHWRANIHSSERMKHQRAVQDMQDNLQYMCTLLERFDKSLKRPYALLDEKVALKWQLDETEGRNRMRMRILPDSGTRREEYQPKRKVSEMAAKNNKLKLDTHVPAILNKDAVSATPTAAQGIGGFDQSDGEDGRPRSTSDTNSESGLQEYEMVDDPKEDEDGYEDKNRKVMRTIQHGDQILSVFNTARIVGLEAYEKLLIIGKERLYLLDDYFQRSDGEIISSKQAPADERDPYLDMISGQERKTQKPEKSDEEKRPVHWSWSGVLSISKRRFLFRDVAIELFFGDGRSYLLTAISQQVRDDLFSRITNKAPHVNSPSANSTPEDAWRLESLRNPDEAPPTLGSKWASVFNAATTNPATKRWLKGEISNFAYLMLINTLAGRTFNDLTQYPVFPWVLADYTSDELDLSNPRTFRDFSRPMGCQTPSREIQFQERYKALKEMMSGPEDQPPFHYGTHYSSALNVSSFLIRLQPYVHSYLLLQGGSFDHPDRLFYSIEQAWLSASKESMADVRELTPEFFYLPEVLTNINGYNFGQRANGQSIDNVTLPPWAKGDPHIFVAKHREALESPYVTKNLHKWIDLVFGHKQRGEAAVEATNVFNHLSYRGAIDLDTIEDRQEKLSTIGVIHHFGQTPQQIFHRPHVSKDDGNHRHKSLDRDAVNLIRLPSPSLESHERVASILYSAKLDRILVSAAFRINMPLHYERYMEWGFADASVRFYNADNRKLLGLFEHLHQGQLSHAIFADSKTLITAGTDCTINIYGVSQHSKVVDIQPKICLFGHRTPVTLLASSRSFGTFLSVSTDGMVFLWDLNRHEFLRRLQYSGDAVQCARINSITGHIMLCSSQKLYLYTLNGHLLLSQRICDDIDDVISSSAFYEGVGNEWLERELIFTGHRWGIVNIWTPIITSQGNWELILIKRMDHVDTSRGDGQNFAAAITCILPMSNTVYTGDEEGRVYEWNVPKNSR